MDKREVEKKSNNLLCTNTASLFTRSAILLKKKPKPKQFNDKGHENERPPSTLGRMIVSKIKKNKKSDTIHQESKGEICKRTCREWQHLNNFYFQINPNSTSMVEWVCKESKENNSNQMTQKCIYEVELESLFCVGLTTFRYMIRNQVNVTKYMGFGKYSPWWQYL